MTNIVAQPAARALLGALMLACGAAALPAHAATNVGVSVNVGQPGFFGRIDIGNQPPPVVVYPQPVVVAPAPYAVVQRPIYLRVPPGYERDWGHYCGRYNACGQPVYFVQEGWYREHYAPRSGYREGYRDRRDEHRDERRDDGHRGRGHDRDHDHGDRGDRGDRGH